MKKILLFGVLVTFFNAGCNIFDLIDSPSGDAQIISAARACFDQGDFDCALEKYGELAADSDIRNSEEAFAILDQQGIGMGAFMSAIGNGRGGGDIVTRLSNEVSKAGLSESKRLQLQSAFSKTANVTDAPLRGLVRFATAIGLLAHFLAEFDGGDNDLQKADLVPTASACESGGLAACIANCSGSITGASTVDLTSSASVMGVVTLGMVDAAITEITTALGSTELGATGKFGSGPSEFAAALDAGDPLGIQTAITSY